MADGFSITVKTNLLPVPADAAITAATIDFAFVDSNFNSPLIDQTQNRTVPTVSSPTVQPQHSFVNDKIATDRSTELASQNLSPFIT